MLIHILEVCENFFKLADDVIDTSLVELAILTPIPKDFPEEIIKLVFGSVALDTFFNPTVGSHDLEARHCEA